MKFEGLKKEKNKMNGLSKLYWYLLQLCEIGIF